MDVCRKPCSHSWKYSFILCFVYSVPRNLCLVHLQMRNAVSFFLLSGLIGISGLFASALIVFLAGSFFGFSPSILLVANFGILVIFAFVWFLTRGLTRLNRNRLIRQEASITAEHNRQLRRIATQSRCYSPRHQIGHSPFHRV